MRAYREVVHGLALKALEHGAAMRSQVGLDWHAAGDCRAPVLRDMEGRPHAANRKSKMVSVPTDGTPIFVTMAMRCRQCDRCLAARARLWRLRAESETRMAGRTWFATFTFSPQQHFAMLSRARSRLDKGGTDFDALDERGQWSERHREDAREFTLYFKRLRKNTGAQLRYLLTAESHRNGLPHYHALIHESIQSQPVKFRDLQACWPHGFTTFKLVEGVKVARYVTKYISKSAEARIRASIGYGKEGLGENLFSEEKRLSPIF